MVSVKGSSELSFLVMVANNYFWNGSSIYLRSGNDGLLVKNSNVFLV